LEVILNAQNQSAQNLFDKLTINCGESNSSADYISWDLPIEQFLLKSDNFDINVIGELNHYDGTALLFKSKLINAFINRYPKTILLMERPFTSAAVLDERFRLGIDSTYIPFTYEFGGGMIISGSKEALAAAIQHKYEIPDSSFIFGGMDTEDTSLYTGIFLDSLILQLEKSDSEVCQKAIPAVHILKKNHQYESWPRKKANSYWRKLDDKLHYEAVQRVLACKCLSPIQIQALKSDELFHTFIKQWFSKSRKHPFYGSYVSIIRDSIMAENVAWYKSQFPDHKILVSVSNYHASKTFTNIHKKYNEQGKPMVYYLEKKFPEKVYTVPIIRFKGASDQWKYKDQYYEEVLSKPDYSIENYFSKKCKTVGYIDISKLKRNEKFWLHATFSNGYNYNWQNSYDGLIFIYNMKTDTKRSIRGLSIFPN